MSKLMGVVGWGFYVLTAAGCGGGASQSPGAASGGNATATAEDQATAGGKLYGEYCAKCHGAGGEGSAKAPAVVGKNALPLDPHPPSQARKTKFHTAGDVLQFVKANMPGDKPGSLTDEQYAAIIAFDLKANGVDLAGKKIDATTASTFVLHP